jgi:hypothetical protein
MLYIYFDKKHPQSINSFPIPQSKRECGRLVEQFIGVDGPLGNRLRLNAKRRMWRAVKLRKSGKFTLEPSWGRIVEIDLNE